MAQLFVAHPEQQEAVRRMDEKIFNAVAQTPANSMARTRVARVIDAALASNTINEDQAKATKGSH